MSTEKRINFTAEDILNVYFDCPACGLRSGVIDVGRIGNAIIACQQHTCGHAYPRRDDKNAPPFGTEEVAVLLAVQKLRDKLRTEGEVPVEKHGAKPFRVVFEIEDCSSRK